MPNGSIFSLRLPVKMKGWSSIIDTTSFRSEFYCIVHFLPMRSMGTPPTRILLLDRLPLTFGSFSLVSSINRVYTTVSPILSYTATFCDAPKLTDMLFREGLLNYSC